MSAEAARILADAIRESVALIGWVADVAILAAGALLLLTNRGRPR